MVDGADHSGISIASEPYGATFSSERALSYDPIPRKLEPHNCNPSERQAKLSTGFLQHRCGGMWGVAHFRFPWDKNVRAWQSANRWRSIEGTRGVMRGLDLFDVRGEMAAYSGLFHLPRHVNLWPNRRLSQVCELQTQRAREGVSPFAHDDPGVAPPNVFPMPSQAGNSRNAK